MGEEPGIHEKVSDLSHVNLKMLQIWQAINLDPPCKGTARWIEVYAPEYAAGRSRWSSDSAQLRQCRSAQYKTINQSS